MCCEMLGAAMLMTDAWFYLEELAAAGGRMTLDERESRHASGARRLREGERITVFDGRGRVGGATIVSASSRKIVVEVGELHVEPPLVPEIHLAAALPKGDRQSVMLSMATQLGMASFTPLHCERSVAKPGRGFAERAERICLEACKQSRNARLPIIHQSSSLAELIGEHVVNSAAVMVAHPHGTPIHDAMRQQSAADRLAVVVGPEGGLTSDEAEAARDAGALIVGLGRTMLRTETAAAAMMSFVRLFAGSQ
jgi:16S rRNA (uracil1498-N3)-methyltransferase